MLSGQAVKGLCQFLGVLVLSRLLRPEVFGVTAIAAVLIGLGELVRDVGLTTAAIRQPQLTPAERSGLFWLNLGFGIAATGIICGLAPLLALKLPTKLPTLAFVLVAAPFLINGLAAQSRADLLRSSKFKTIAITDALGAVVSLAIGVGLAISGIGYWSLLFQLVSAPIVASTGILVAKPYSPGPISTISAAKKFVPFGLHVAVSQTISYLGNNIDVSAMTIRTGTVQVGLYNRAFQIVMAPIALLQLPVQNSLVPVLSRRRSSTSAYTILAHRAQFAVGVVVVFFPAVIAASSRGLVPLALGPGWGGSIDATWLLCGAAAAQIIASVANWIMIVEGRGRLLVIYSLVSLVVKLVFIVPAAPYGATRVALAYFLASMLLMPIVIIGACYSSSLSTRKTLLIAVGLFAIYLSGASLGRIGSRLADSPLLATVLGGGVAALVYSLTLVPSRSRVVLRSVLPRGK